MDYTGREMRSFWWLCIGVMIGFILNHNFAMNQYAYRISFYGYKYTDNEAWPIIKIKKCFRDDTTAFYKDDEGVFLEMRQPGQSVQFTEAEINKAMK